MAKSKQKFWWKSHQCPDCGCWHNEQISVHGQGSANSRTWGSIKGKFAFDRSAIKSQATYRVWKNPETGEWEKHPNPKWSDDHQKYPVINCCKHYGKKVSQ